MTEEKYAQLYITGLETDILKLKNLLTTEADSTMKAKYEAEIKESEQEIANIRNNTLSPELKNRFEKESVGYRSVGQQLERYAKFTGTVDSKNKNLKITALPCVNIESYNVTTTSSSVVFTRK